MGSLFYGGIFSLRKYVLLILTLSVLALTAPAGAYPKRIVSMSPVGTEILYALGQGKNVVGVTDFCDYPPEARKKPKVGGFATVSLEKLVAMKADLLVLADLQLGFRNDLDRLKIPYVFIMQKDLASVYKSIEETGRLCGAEKNAAALVAKIKSDEAAVCAKVKGLPKKSVVLCVSRELSDQTVNIFYAAGKDTFYNELLEMAGGINAVPPSRAEYPKISSEGLMTMDPEVIIDIVGERTFYHSMEKVDLNKVFNKTYMKKQWLNGPRVRATQSGRVTILDGTMYLRPGPRLGQVLLAFAKALHPEAKW